MTTSATQDFLSEIVKGEPIPGGKLAYFRARLSGRIHQAMLRVFGGLELQKYFTRRDLARRIGRKPEQITRWFSYPGNLTLDTVSDIFLGLGCELEAVVVVNLATGARLQFPEQPSNRQQEITDSSEDLQTARSNVVPMQPHREARQRIQEYQAARPAPVPTQLVPPPNRGMAESDQLDARLSRHFPNREMIA